MGNKRIAKLTLDGYFNYGNLLQNYALQQVLLRYGESVENIWHDKQDTFLPSSWWKNWSWKDLVKYLLNWKGYRANFRSGQVGWEMVRQGKLKDWCDRYVHERYGVKDLHNIADEYDFFVVGSDQVWNPYIADLQDNFLSFAPKEKRISYAASISTPEIPAEWMEQFKTGINGMHAIDVREQAGADLIEKLTGRKAEVHFDPTMLLTPEEWRTVSRQPTWYHGQDYILTYFLGKRPEAVEQVAQETGLPVVNLLDENVYEHYVTGVDEFIWAIEHAKLLYTDSFHGTVFSILFRTPFVICNRVGDATMEKMGSRIDTLLGYFGLEERRGTKANAYRIENPLASPDWSRIEPVLEKERKRSADYFEHVFGTKGIREQDLSEG